MGCHTCLVEPLTISAQGPGGRPPPGPLDAGKIRNTKEDQQSHLETRQLTPMDGTRSSLSKVPYCSILLASGIRACRYRHVDLGYQ